MRFQLGWLRQHVDLPESTEEIADRLTSMGLTVDEVEGEGDAAVLDLDIGANRCDAMSHVGVARELAAAFGRELELRRPSISEEGPAIADLTSVTVEAKDLCPRYAARVVRDVRIGPSPPWMAGRLEACGVRPINVVVDVTNYVLLELGQPLHAFDLDLLDEGRIVVRRAEAGETLETLDGEQRELWPDALLIADASRGVALAGVMGGANSEIRDTTRHVLLESAWFDPVAIRRASQRLGLRTEASHRFERGTDVDVVLLALDRAAALLAEHAGGRVSAGVLDACEELPDEGRVTLRRDRLRRLGGVDVPGHRVEQILTALGFEIESSHAERWTVRVPRRRRDVTLEADLIEEVLRHHGYDQVPATLPSFRDGARPRQRWERGLARLRSGLVASGYHQAVTFTFGESADGEAWGWSLGGDRQARAVPLDNPMSEAQAVMRISLVPGLLRATSHSLRRGETDVRLFEEGAVFLRRTEAGDTPLEERRTLALVATGRSGPRHFARATPEVDLLAVKGVLVDVLARAVGTRDDLSIHPESLPRAAPGSAARVRLAGRSIGWLARVHPDALSPFEIDQSVIAAEVDLEPVLEAATSSVRFTAYSRFPKAVRDLSVLVDRNLSYGKLVGVAQGLMGAPEGRAMENVQLIDRYLGEGVPDDKVSMTFSVTYRHPERTLTQDEVDGMHERLLDALRAEFGAELRG